MPNVLVTVGLRGALDPETSRQVANNDLVAHLRMFRYLLEMVETNGVYVSGGPNTTVPRLVGGLEDVGVENPSVRNLANTVSRAVKNATDRFLPYAAYARNTGTDAHCGCPAIACDFVIDVTPQASSPDSTRCLDCSARIVPLQHILHANETRFLRKCPQIFVDQEWTKDRFEQEVWKPLFRFANTAEIYDRQIYRIVEGTINSAKAADRDQYIAGVKWICKAFGEAAAPHRSLAGKPSPRVLIFNGEFRRTMMKEAMKSLGQRSTDHPDALLRCAGTQILRRECEIDRIEQDHAIKVRFGINLFEWPGRPSPRMRHNRYVKTPYAYVAIDRGIPVFQGEPHLSMTDVIPLGRGIESVNPGACNFSFA